MLQHHGPLGEAGSSESSALQDPQRAHQKRAKSLKLEATGVRGSYRAHLSGTNWISCGFSGLPRLCILTSAAALRPDLAALSAACRVTLQVTLR